MIIEYWNKVRSFVKWLIPFFLAIFLLFGCGPAQTQESRADMPVHQEQAGQAETSALALDKDGSYTSKEDVALYIHIDVYKRQAFNQERIPLVGFFLD